VPIGYLVPADVLVEGDRAFICDLGVLEHMFPDVGARLVVRHPQLNFIAPERQHMPLRVTAPSDVFSAAAIAFWLLVGWAPVVTGPAEPTSILGQLTGLHLDLAPEVGELLAGMLSWQAEERPTAAAALQRLTPFVGNLHGQTAPRPSTAEATSLIPAERARPTAARPVVVPRPPEPADGTHAPVPGWRELGDDILWQVRRHPVAAAGLGLVAAALVWVRPAPAIPPPPPAPPLLAVASGKLVRSLGAGEARYSGEWRSISQVAAGNIVTAREGSANLAFRQSHLTLSPGALMTCRGLDGTALSVDLSQGQMRVLTGAGDTVEVAFAPGDIVSIPPASDTTLDVDRHQVTCATGHFDLSGSGWTHPVSAGTTLHLDRGGRPGP
jgi:hypothetical protein